MEKSEILKTLKRYKKFDTDKEFASYLGVSPQCLKNWYTRNRFDTCRVVERFPEISVEFLTGASESMSGEAESTQPETNETIRKLIDMLESKDRQIERLLAIIEQQRV